MGVLEGQRKSNAAKEKRTPMKRYLKFAASFWVSAFLVTGSMAMAQSAPSAKTKKKAGSNSSTQSATAPAATSTTPTPVAHDQASGTATTSATTPATSTAPKMVVGPDKHMIPAPQI